MDLDLTTTLDLGEGLLATVRPLRAGDAQALARFFGGLSERTRSFYGPHAFDRETAERLCAEAGDPRTVRFVAVLDAEDGVAEMIAYMILTRELGEGDVRRYAEHGPALDAAGIASFAPSVADAWQGRGIGTRMARHVIECARRLGLRQVILMGGVQSLNARGRRLYERLGFRYVGEFTVERRGETLGSYDMILEL